MSDQIDNSPEKIRIIIRTELLTLVDSIVNTPYELLTTIKMADLHINKFFINVIEYYLKLLEGSKKFVGFMESN